MRSSFFGGTAFALAGALTLWSCGGSSPAPTNPTPTPTPTPNPGVTINIVGSSGTAAYQPNPVMNVSSGTSVTFKNNDSRTHHVVMDDGSIDFGDLTPGASKSGTVRGAGGNFHCTIHSSMVGSINGTPPEPPPCNTPGYCG